MQPSFTFQTVSSVFGTLCLNIESLLHLSLLLKMVYSSLSQFIDVVLCNARFLFDVVFMCNV